jgi:hypothetical protein
MDSKLLKSVRKYINNMSIGQYLYIQNLMSIFGLSSPILHRELKFFENNHIIKKTYKSYCSSCHNISDDTYDSLKELESYEFCEQCNYKLVNLNNKPKNFLILFVKIKNFEMESD